jgi:HK97 family phage prohead protease
MPPTDKSERATKHRGLERRVYPVKLEVRAADAAGGPTVVEGYASVTETPYTMWDWLGSYAEIVRAGAFTKTLSENPQVQLLLNHGGLSMSYTRAGRLELAEDSQGLHIRAKVNTDRSDVRDMVLALEDGDVDEMSMAFRVPAGKSVWSPDYDQRDILEVDLHRGDVSIVRAAALVEDLDHLDEADARVLLERLQRRLTPAPPAVAGRPAQLAAAELELLRLR